MEENKLYLKCLFCSSTEFNFPHDDYEPQAGEQILCTNCGRTNDFDSLMRVVEEQATEIVKANLEKEIKKISKILRIKL